MESSIACRYFSCSRLLDDSEDEAEAAVQENDVSLTDSTLQS